MRNTIKPKVRKDGTSFVDKEHFGDGKPIRGWKCNDCNFYTETTNFDDSKNYKEGDAKADVTLGFYGPNGNGYNYWCPKCDHRMSAVS